MIVYKITNMNNYKIYVGQTKFTAEKRFKEHSKANSLIGNAIRKYGEEQFSLEVLAICETREQAYENWKCTSLQNLIVWHQKVIT